MAKRVAASGPVEEPWALPDGWRWERIDAVAPVNPRRGPDNLDETAEVAFVPMAAVEAKTGGIDTSGRRAIGSVRKGFTRFASGDVIFAKITPCMENGKIAVVPDLPHGVGFGSTEFHVLAPREVSSRYLYHWVSQRGFRETAEFNMTGTAGQKRVPTDFMRDALVPVPPRPVQDALVARIDELFAEIDDGEAALARARDDLATWRKALLKAAVTGELTADWRAANPPVESGANLLARVLAARREGWQAATRNKGKRYVEPAGPSLDTLSKLPEGWTWASLAQVASIGSGTTPSRADPRYWGGETPWLKSGCVNDEVVVAAEEYVTPAAVLEARLKTYPIGTLVVALYGEGKTRGKCAILDIAASINQALGAVQVASGLEVSWIKLVLDADYEKNRMISAGGVQPNLNLIKLGALPIPLPPLAEREVIGDRVQDDLVAHEELVEARLTASARSATLRQSILTAAFRGELA